MSQTKVTPPVFKGASSQIDKAPTPIRPEISHSNLPVYVVQIAAKRGRRKNDIIASQTLLWDRPHPLSAGHPVRWILERTTTGVRIRALSKELGSISSGQVFALSHAEIRAGHSVRFHDLEISVRPYQKLPVASRAWTTQAGAAQDTKSEIRIFHCVGSTVRSSVALTRTHDARSGKVPLFSVRTLEGGIELSIQHPELKIESGDRTKSSDGILKSGETRRFSGAELQSLSVRWGNEVWHFAHASAPLVPSLSSRPLAAFELAERKSFAQALRWSGGLTCALLLLASLLPAPKAPENELVPMQIAKLIMKPKSSGAPRSETQNTQPAAAAVAEAPKQVQKTAIAQAFRAKALQNALSGLMRGGMTALLKQSNWVATSKGGAILDRGSSAIAQAGRAPASSTGKSVEVAALGGGAAGGGVGYGTGERAGVKGQGGAFVDLDMGAGAVQEGLTKDEVGKVIHAHMSEVRYCYESSMIRNPDLEGKLMVDFTIGGSGFVKSSSVKQSTLGDASLDDCILRRLGKWAFPKPKGGVDVAVSYPFIFKTLGR